MKRSFILYLLISFLVGFLLNSNPCYTQEKSSDTEPYYIFRQFIASGYMGDTNNIELYEYWYDIPYDSTDLDSACIKITYSPGSVGWAGIYWQNRANNWGEYPGFDFSDSGYTELIFWAKGETGRDRERDS